MIPMQKTEEKDNKSYQQKRKIDKLKLVLKVKAYYV